MIATSHVEPSKDAIEELNFKSPLILINSNLSSLLRLILEAQTFKQKFYFELL